MCKIENVKLCNNLKRIHNERDILAVDANAKNTKLLNRLVRFFNFYLLTYLFFFYFLEFCFDFPIFCFYSPCHFPFAPTLVIQLFLWWLLFTGLFWISKTSLDIAGANKKSHNSKTIGFFALSKHKMNYKECNGIQNV